jgi:hypothetical protein
MPPFANVADWKDFAAIVLSLRAPDSSETDSPMSQNLSAEIETHVGSRS